MTKKEFEKLSVGQFVTHKRYGVSEIVDILIDFGICICPITYNGYVLLFFDARTNELFKDNPIGAPFLETTPREVQNYTPSWIINKTNE